MRPAYFQGIATYVASAGRTLQSPGRLFVAEDGAAASRSNSRSIRSCGLEAALQRIFRRAGMDWRGRGPHSLRHTFAIMALREGGNIVAVMKLLGHANLNTTLTYVNHLDLKELREGLPSGGPPVAAAPVVPAGALTIEQSAARLGVHRDVVRSLLRRHELTGSASRRARRDRGCACSGARPTA